MAGGAGRQAFERLTDVAKRVLAAAQDEAIARRHRHVGTEHLLLGLVAQGGDAAAARTLADRGATLESVRAAVERAQVGGA